MEQINEQLDLFPYSLWRGKCKEKQVYAQVHDDTSTVSTKQCTITVEFGKRSNKLKGEMEWLTYLFLNIVALLV